MTDKVCISKVDETYIHIDAPRAILLELSDRFTFDVPNAAFIPSVKNKMWDGKIRLLNRNTQTLYLGLHSYVKQYCEENDVECHYLDPLDVESPFSIDEFKSMVAALKLSVTVDGVREQIEPHDFQQQAVIHAIQSGRSLLLSPTSSGKSLMIYLLLRYYLARTKGKILVIVPNTGLVKQLFDDISDYSELIPWNAEDNCHLLYDGGEKHTGKRIIISTWQALAVKQSIPPSLKGKMSTAQQKTWRKSAPYVLDQKYFDEVSAVIGDEAHMYAADECSAIMAKLRSAKYRFGTTGTLRDSKTNQMVLEGLFGSVYQTITTKELMDRKDVAQLTIKCLQLQYSDLERKEMRKKTYAEEMEFLQAHPGRNTFIRNLALSLPGNTLILFEKIDKHGKILHELIAAKIEPGRKLFYADGKTKTDDRNVIRKVADAQTNAIIAASYGTFSTGISMRNINNIIFSSPTKSKVRVLQSIGRGLRLSKRKSEVTLYDLADDLSVWNRNGSDVWDNYSLQHFTERVHYYNHEQFDYKKYKIQLQAA